MRHTDMPLQTNMQTGMHVQKGCRELSGERERGACDGWHGAWRSMGRGAWSLQRGVCGLEFVAWVAEQVSRASRCVSVGMCVGRARG